MPPRPHRRHVLLFLIAILLPCLVLVALSLRMISQERELAEKRLAEERDRLVGQIRQELLARLERIKLQEVAALAAPLHAITRVPPAAQADPARAANYQHPAVVLAGWVENNRLVLPWENNRSAEEFRRLLSEAEFARRIQRGEQEEHVSRQLGKAAQLYREAMNVARHPAQSAHARLLLARVLARSGGRSEAHTHYQKVLALSSDVTDEHGVPLALYAAGRLLEAGVGRAEVRDRVAAEVTAWGWLPPAECYMLRGLADSLVETARKSNDPIARETAQGIQRKILERIRSLEQALALENDFPNLGLMPAGGSQSRNPEPIWAPYGEETWLVSVAPPLAGLRPVAVAVRAREIFASLDAVGARPTSLPGELQFLIRGDRPPGRSFGGEPKAQFLGPNFPGVRVAFATKEDAAFARKWNLQRSFYLVALLLVLIVTLFGAYFVWRDVRRELRLAELRSQFVSSVTHELKTPLTAIRMFAETLQMGRSTDPQMQAEYLETIVNESERLTRLVDNVLNFSKIEQGKKIYRPQPASLAEVVRAAARAMRYPLAQQGFELRVDAADELAPVRVDPDALQQAILNLLTNAMKYSGHSRRIDLRLRTQDGQAVIQVSDRGLGIAPADQARIFEKFYRVPTRENQLIPGTGLGLTLVEHIARAHGGRVSVESAPGEGSTFSIHLPLEEFKV